MKNLKVAAIVGGLILSSMSGLLALTNPNQETYEAFATEQLTGYLSKNVCAEAPTDFGIREQCENTLKSNQAEIRRLVSNSTHRQNYILFSVYTTDLSVSSLLPSYHFETIGILQQFHTYQAQKT